MHSLSQLRFPERPLLAASILILIVSCTGNINSPTPAAPPIATTSTDVACPMIADQATTICPRLKNIALSCGGNGMLHTSIGGGSGSPFTLGVKLDDGSMLSAVVVVVNCQDGPREGVTLGVTYTGQVATPASATACISQSKAVYSQFQFGNPLYAGFEDLAKDQLHQTLDSQAIIAFNSKLGLPASTSGRCSFWREMP